MKKILYIVTQSEFGGAQRYVFDLATHLASESKIIVAAGENPDGPLLSNLWKFNLHSSKSNLPKIKTIYLKHLKRAINPWHDILAFFELRRLIKKERPDIVHLNSSKAGVLGSLAAEFQVLSWNKFLASESKFQVLYTAHGWVFNEPLSWLRQKIYFYAEKWTARYKDKIICVSEHDRQIAIKSGFPAEKLTTIHNGIDTTALNFLDRNASRKELIKKIPNSQSLVPSSQIIGSIANLYPTKGIAYLIEAAEILNTQYSILNTIFLVIGEGPERPKLKKLIQKYNLENNFFLLGHIPNAYKYLSAFDIFVLPSVKEGLPYTILEAMSAGLPIIATEVGGLPEMLTPPFFKGGLARSAREAKRGGILIQPQNPRQLAEKIITLSKDESLRKNLSACAKEIVTKSFSLDTMINSTKIIYKTKPL